MRCNFGFSGFQKESEYVQTKKLPKNYCAEKVTLITQAVDWWFRGNQYKAAEHFVGAAGLNDWNQIK